MGRIQSSWVGEPPWPGFDSQSGKPSSWRRKLHYSCLEKPMDRGAGWARVHRVAKSQT